MLRFMRDNAKSGFLKFFLLGFLLLAGGGLVMMDVGNFFSGGVRGQTDVLVVGKDRVSMQNFSVMLRRALSRQGIDAETAYKLGMIDKMLNSEISNSLTRQAATDYGVLIGDQIVGAQIARLLEPAIENGMSKEDAFARVLRMQGMTEQGFVQILRQEMTNAVLKNALTAATSYTPSQEVEDLYRYQHESREVEGIFFPNDKITDYKEPTDEMLLPFYQSGQEKYAIPETRSFTMAVLNHDKLKDTIEITDEELQDIYENEIESFKLPEQRTLEQSVIENQSDALKISDLMKNDGKSMKDAVNTVTGSEDAYLGEDNFQQEGLDESISETAFGAATEGDVIGPFQTPLGWHVLKVVKIIPPSTQPFADVKDMLRQEILQDRLATQMYDMANNIDTQIAEGSSIEEVSEHLGLDIKTYGPMREDGSTPDNKEGIPEDFKQDRSFILQTVFELLQTETAPVMELADGRFALIRVDSVTEKSYKPFDDVKAELGKLWIKDQQAGLNKLMVQNALDSAVNGQMDLDDLAREHGLKIQTFKNVTRIDPAPKGLSNTAKTKFFELQKGEYTVTSDRDGYFIGRVSKITLPDLSKATEEDLASVEDISNRGTVDEFMLLFLENERIKRGVEINKDAITQAFGPGNEQNF